MTNFISYEGYHIKKSTLNKDKIEQIKKELTVTPVTLNIQPKKTAKTKENTKKTVDTSYTLYTEDNKYLKVPIYYGIEKFGKVKNKMEKMEGNIDFKGELRDYQKPIVEKCLEYMKENGGGLLSIPCGGGKTSIAIYIASILKLKTLVIVHKRFLLNQWINRIKQFTSCEPGIIKGKTIDVDDKDIVIGMIQSISMKDYDPDLFKQFSFVIYDESHHSASKVFSRCLLKTTALYTLALSATPYRGDKLIKVMHWFLGKTIYRIKFKINKYVVVKCYNYYTNDILFKEKKKYFSGKFLPNVPKMISNLCELRKRTRYIANIIDTIRKDQDRKILILSERVSHLQELKDIVDLKIKRSIENNEIDENDIKTSFYIGKMKDKQREEAEQNADILFATYHLAKEGLDIERLNTVVLATSYKDVNQSVGRIMRKLLSDGDNVPLIIDFSDDLSVFSNHAKIRKEFYNKCKYNISEYYINNSTLVSHNDYLKCKLDDKYTIKEEKRKSLKKSLRTEKINMTNLTVDDVLFNNNDDNTESEDEFDTKPMSFIDKFKTRIF